MRRLEDLINQYCPDGVEYKPISEVIDSLKTGLNPRKNFKLNDVGACCYYITGKDVYSNRINVSERTDKITKDAVKLINKRACLHDDVLLFVSTGTGTVGRMTVVDKYTGDWNVSETMYIISTKSETITTKFLFYVLYSNIAKEQYEPKISKGSVPHLKVSDLLNVETPVPPLPVQEEIVRFLDKMTELEAALETELDLRKKQYEYYRDKMISEEYLEQHCPDGVEYKPIKELYKRVKGTPITAGQMKNISKPDGDIRVFAGGKTVIDAFEKDIPKANITRVPAVLVQSRGVIGFIYYDKPFTFKNEMWAYTLKDNNDMSLKYLYYVLSHNEEYFRGAAAGMGSLPQISLPVTEDFEIPIPPLSVQEEIVRFLDKFSTLTADDSEGLPAEIKMRQKQFEYYREKILSFKRIEN